MVKPADADSDELRARTEQPRATWTIRHYIDFDQMKADEYAYLPSQPAHVRIAAIAELATEPYAMKGQHVQRFQTTLVRVERA